METINERFAHLLKEKQISIKEMAHRMGKSEVYVRKLTQAGQSFGIEPVRATIDALPDVSPDWLLYGRGDVLRPRLTTNTEGRGVPYYEDIEATCSLLSTYDDSPERPTFFIDYEHFNDCTAYLPVVGDSMVPQYCAGEIIAVKRVWNLDIIQWGEAYLVVTDSEANSLRTVLEPRLRRRHGHPQGTHRRPLPHQRQNQAQPALTAYNAHHPARPAARTTPPKPPTRRGATCDARTATARMHASATRAT